MASSRCLACKGSGRVIGNGMMAADCRACGGDGFVDAHAEKADAKIDRRSAEYKQAIKKIMESGVSKDEAARIFDEEFEKL